MSDVPPFPNSVNADPLNMKHQINKVEVDRLKSKHTTDKGELIVTQIDANIYIYRNNEISVTTPKITGQLISRNV